MKKKKMHSKAAAMLLAVLMMFGVFFAGTSTVSAANEGTLHIHKLSSVGVATQESGKYYYQNPADNLYYEYLAGAKYTIYKIGTFAETNVGGTISTVFTADPNLVMMTGKTFGSATEPGDINFAASITAGLSGSVTGETTATGPLTIGTSTGITTSLDANGVYLIVESTLPSGIAAGVDFIITVPMYNLSTKVWETTVNAYPKNTKSDGAIEKTVTEIDGTAVTGTNNTFYANTGSILTYSVDVTVPNDYITNDTDAAKNYTKFNIIDESSQYLELQNPSATFAEDITITGTNSFTAGTDYTATYTTGTSNKLTITFTTTGLAKIVAGETLTVTYEAEILAGAAGSTGAVTNKAWIEFTKGSGGGTIEPPTTEPPTVKIYSYGVKKVDDSATPVPLAGASFKIATKDASGNYEYLAYDATNGVWDIVVETAADVFTTSVNTPVTGIADEAILQFKNLDPAKTYYLIETAAPSGFIKLLAPVEIKATAGTTETVYNTYNNGTYVPNTGYTLKITNVSESNGGITGGGGLPTTGGNGIYLFLIIGGVLMGSAVVFYIRLRKKGKAV